MKGRCCLADILPPWLYAREAKGQRSGGEARGSDGTHGTSMSYDSTSPAHIGAALLDAGEIDQDPMCIDEVIIWNGRRANKAGIMARRRV